MASQLEEALQSIPGSEEVMLPFWDETSDDSVTKGIPWALTQKEFALDGETIPNPLRSFVFNQGITDNINGDNPNCSKPKGYETVRYPFAGRGSAGSACGAARGPQHQGLTLAPARKKQVRLEVR